MSALNDPRVLFAAERTLMAWNRTAIALITLGFVIERFGLFVKITHVNAIAGQRHLSFWIGLTLIGFAALTNLLSIYQFWRVRRELSIEEIPGGYSVWMAATLNLAISILAVILIYYLVRGFNS